MNLRYLLIPGLACLVCLFSCESTSNQSASAPRGYELQIVDSVQVDLLAKTFVITDVHEDTGELLAIQTSPPVAYVLSPEGKVLKKMDRPGDDPQAVGSRILCGEFFEDGIALMGQMVVKTYDADFNLRKSMKAMYPQQGMIYLGANHMFEITQPEKNLLISYFGPQTDLPPLQAEFYAEYNVVDVLNPHAVETTNANMSKEAQKEVYKPIGKFTEDSRYLKGRAFYFMRPIFDVKAEVMTYAYQDDTSLFRMAVPSGEIIDRWKIPFDKFVLFQGLSLGQKGIGEQGQPRDRNGRINHIYQVGKHDLIVYNSGIKLTELEQFDKTSPDFRGQLRKADYMKYLILEDGKQVNAEVRFPEKVSYLDMADDQGFIWGHQNVRVLEEEPELITFYKLRIVAVEE